MPIESPERLRQICQSGKETDPSWYVVHRRISIYLTWALLHTPVRPNQVTGAMMAFGVVGALLLAPRGMAVNVAGFAVLYLVFLLDKVDGEIARYRGTPSVRGLLLDRLHHLAIEPLIFLAAAWHDHARSGSAAVWVAAWAVMVLGNLVDEHQHLSAYILFKHVKSTRSRPRPLRRPVPRGLALGLRLFRPLKGFRMFIVALPSLALAYAAEAVTGAPVIRTYLIIGALALTALLVFQFYYYLTYKLEAEIGEQADLLADPVPSAGASRERPAERSTHRPDNITNLHEAREARNTRRA